MIKCIKNFILILSLVILSFSFTIDHSSVSTYNKIPDRYIDSVKTMMINIPGESHGRGYMYGLSLMYDLDSKYKDSIVWTGEPIINTNQYVRGVRTFWNGTGWTATGGEEDWYTNSSAIAVMNNHLSKMDSTNNIDVFMFGWCWDMTWHNNPGGIIDSVNWVRWAGSSEGGPQGDLIWGLNSADSLLTNNSICMQSYLDATENYRTSHPTTKVVFTTGPADNHTDDENGYQRYLKHQYIKAYVAADSNNRHLFDYCDILSYNNSGSQYIDSDGWTDHNGTKHTYPTIHSDNKGTYDGGNGDCHISEAGCLRLGKALWVMAARLKGWNGIDSNITNITISNSYTQSGSINCTWIRVSSTDTVRFNDTIYVRDSVIYDTNSKIVGNNNSIILTTQGYTCIVKLNGHNNTPRIKNRGKLKWR
jgi:hypothetical protein